MAQPTNVAVKPTLPLLSDEQESGIRSAFKTLLVAVGAYGTTVLPTFDDLTVDQYEILANRALKGIKVLNQARREEKLRAIRQGVKDVVNIYIGTARAEKSAYDLMLAETPSAMRAYIKPFPTAVSIPMSEVIPSFPEGTKPETMVVILKEMSYTVGKNNGNYYISVPTPFMASATAAK